MNYQAIKEIVIERNPKACFLDSCFDEALIGTAIHCGEQHVAAYDSNKCLEILMKQKNMGDAYEEFQEIVENVFYSENSPVIFSDFTQSKEA